MTEIDRLNKVAQDLLQALQTVGAVVGFAAIMDPAFREVDKIARAAIQKAHDEGVKVVP